MCELCHAWLLINRVEEEEVRKQRQSQLLAKYWQTLKEEKKQNQLPRRLQDPFYLRSFCVSFHQPLPKICTEKCDRTHMNMILVPTGIISEPLAVSTFIQAHIRALPPLTWCSSPAPCSHSEPGPRWGNNVDFLSDSRWVIVYFSATLLWPRPPSACYYD